VLNVSPASEVTFTLTNSVPTPSSDVVLAHPGTDGDQYIAFKVRSLEKAPAAARAFALRAFDSYTLLLVPYR
jgi:hypothetical protein